jgi:hypothetical protein
MAAFAPWVAATLIFDALHFHPFAPEHGPLCRHHITEQANPLRASTGYECPTCNWQRNLPQTTARTWSPDLVRTTIAVYSPAAVAQFVSDGVQPALFRGPPVGRSVA